MTVDETHQAAAHRRYSSAEGVLFDKGQTTLIQCPGGNRYKEFTFWGSDGIFLRMGTPTLGSKLGTTTHLSPLLHKARR